MLGFQELKAILPHAYPFLLLDRVEEYKIDESLVAIKNVTGNEWSQEDSQFEVTHFPETLMIEAAAQAALVLYHVSRVKPGQKPRYILGRSKAEFFQQVGVGEQIQFKVAAGKIMDSGGYVDVQAFLHDESVANMELIFKVNHAL